MGETEFFDIWPMDGITDLDVRPSEIAVGAIQDIIPVWREARQKLAESSLKIFNERMAREWAIETGVIEGVYYIDDSATKTWILQGIDASLLPHQSTDKDPHFVADLVRDHLEALDWIQDEFVKDNQPLNRSRLWQLHSLMTRHQEWVDAIDSTGKPMKVPLVSGRWKEQPNSVMKGGKRYAYCPPHRVDDQMNVLMATHNEHVGKGVPPDVQAAWLHHRFTQIHPFHDGNGRIARALASFIFIKAGLFPLVIGRDEQYRGYIEALREADNGDLAPLVHVLAEAQVSRFDRALNIADDLASVPDSIERAIASLKSVHEASSRGTEQRLASVLDTANALRTYSEQRFKEVQAMLAPVATKIRSSDPGSSHFYWGQVIESARHYKYFANSSVHRSWVRLTIEGDITAQLLLSFHGLGTVTAGAMACAPILELIFRPDDDGAIDGQTRGERKQIHIADAAFRFYFTESRGEVERKFKVWLDETLVLAISQFQRLI